MTMTTKMSSQRSGSCPSLMLVVVLLAAAAASAVSQATLLNDTNVTLSPCDSLLMMNNITNATNITTSVINGTGVFCEEEEEEEGDEEGFILPEDLMNETEAPSIEDMMNVTEAPSSAPSSAPTEFELCTLCTDGQSLVTSPEHVLFFDDGRTCGDWEDEFLDQPMSTDCERFYAAAGGDDVYLELYCNCPGWEGGSIIGCRLCPNELGNGAVYPEAVNADGISCYELANYARALLKFPICMFLQNDYADLCC